MKKLSLVGLILCSLGFVCSEAALACFIMLENIPAVVGMSFLSLSNLWCIIINAVDVFKGDK